MSLMLLSGQLAGKTWLGSQRRKTELVRAANSFLLECLVRGSSTQKRS